MRHNLRARMICAAAPLVLLASPVARALEQVDRPAITFSGTITLAPNTSTLLAAGSAVTMSPNSAPLPAQFQHLTILPPPNCSVTINWLGGTATATSGEPIGEGSFVQRDGVNLTGQTAVPSLFSTLGCSNIFFRN